jgi:hypothetical protein
MEIDIVIPPEKGVSDRTTDIIRTDDSCKNDTAPLANSITHFLAEPVADT